MKNELLNAKKARVDKAGRFTIPKEVREQLVGDAEGVFWWFDGRLHVASSKELLKLAASLGPKRKKKRHPSASR